MSTFQKVIICGNVTADATLKPIGDKNHVSNFGLATSKKYKDKEETEFHQVVVYGQLAEKVAGPYVKKGNKVLVEGELKTSTWEKDGQKHYKIEIVASQLVLMSKPVAREADIASPSDL